MERVSALHAGVGLHKQRSRTDHDPTPYFPQPQPIHLPLIRDLNIYGHPAQ